MFGILCEMVINRHLLLEGKRLIKNYLPRFMNSTTKILSSLTLSSQGSKENNRFNARWLNKIVDYFFHTHRAPWKTGYQANGYTIVTESIPNFMPLRHASM